MKTKSITKYFVIGLLISVLLSIFSFGIRQTAKAEASEEDSISYLTENKYPITNTDAPNGIQINNYALSHYGKKASTSWKTDAKMYIEDSDDIIKIIPSELFKQVGKTLHIGKGYGFFIDCRKPYENNDMLIFHGYADWLTK